MRQKLFVIASCLLLVTGCNQRETVIVNPEFDNSNTEVLQFHKIELTDTATIVYAGVYYYPDGWVSLSSKCILKGADGATYKLKYSNGFELDKQVTMPESGHKSLTLVFDPIAKNEKTVSYCEIIDEKEYCNIEGIKLYNVKHSEPVRCVLKGEVFNRPQSSRLILSKAGEDIRSAKVIYIPIQDGKFEYTLYADAEEEMQLVFEDEMQRGSMLPFNFIAESGVCTFTLYNEEEQDKNVIAGGKYTEAYQTFINQIWNEVKPVFQAITEKQNSLWKENKYYSQEYLALEKQIEEMSDNDPNKGAMKERLYNMDESIALTPEAKALQDESINVYKTMRIEKELNYAKEHRDIAGYTVLVKIIRRAITDKRLKLDPSQMFAVFHEIYEKEYPEHPYTALLNSYMQADKIKVGQPYPDVSAFNVSEGKNVRLSEFVKGKVALIHLWASWCSPCRRHGKAMIPVYEKYKDKGFTVVGIAREKLATTMQSAVEKDQYTWVNLLESDDKNKVWRTFGIEYAGGGDYLIDADGNFLAVNAQPDEIIKILQELFD
jgi:peroxiredoxin